MTEIPEAAIESVARVICENPAPCQDAHDQARAVLTAAWEHLHPVVTHETKGAFYDATHSELLIVRDKYFRVWQAWENDEGEWLATRPRDEDDPDGPLFDRWRPVGPDYVEDLEFPITVTPATVLHRPVEGGESNV